MEHHKIRRITNCTTIIMGLQYYKDKDENNNLVVNQLVEEFLKWT